MWTLENFVGLEEIVLLSVGLVFASDICQCSLGNHIFCIDFLHAVSSLSDQFAEFLQIGKSAGFAGHFY